MCPPANTQHELMGHELVRHLGGGSSARAAFKEHGAQAGLQPAISWDPAQAGPRAEPPPDAHLQNRRRVRLLR